MKFNQNLSIAIIFVISIFYVYCSESSEFKEEKIVILNEDSLLSDLGSAVVESSPGSYVYVDDSSHLDGGDLEYIIVEQQPQVLGGLLAPPAQSLLPQSSFQFESIPFQSQIPVQGRNFQIGDGNRIQWIGGPVDFESMVDCKFYRQNPGFCVPMSIYTPCSRCKAGVRTILRANYRVRCPGKESFPPQLRPYFTWVPTSHRNPRREKGIFKRWRRQFMCIVMAVSVVPNDLSQFWQHSQISIEQPQSAQVPHLLSPYTSQQATFGYGLHQYNPQTIQYYTTIEESDDASKYYVLN
ncbi:hypothetical protein FG386_002915 [Cryptosporidium ryanae]|uniref:uncharacterized protein n=1 Tax=Cryptosporidium ryanae TaxID=515981 RepID=UPI00351A9C7B|nr:hypothetical protein FG386_002915 [Cryptosporidium ryanae]